MKDNFELRLLNEATVDAQVNVYAKAFEITTNIEELKEFWIAKHYKNPIRQSYIFGAYDNDQLVSINAYLPMIYTFDQKDYSVIQSCESGTLPEYRGHGLWSRVVKYAMNYFFNEKKYDFIIGFPNFENSYGGFMKMNWEHRGDVINYVSCVNGKNFIKALLDKKIPFGTKVLELQGCLVSLCRKSMYSICNYDNTFLTTDRNNGFTIRLNDAFINWKIQYKNLKTFGIKKGNEYVGSCYYSIGDYNKQKIVLLHNIQIKMGENSKRILAKCIFEIKKRHSDAAFIRIWAMPKSRLQRDAKKIGFLKSKHHNPFIIYMLSQDDELKRNVQDISNWISITFMDLD